MFAARLHGARDIRYETVPDPGSPGPGDVLLRVGAVGLCGSDLHSYLDGRIGDTVIQSPVVLGHEFAGTIEAVGPDARDGENQPLQAGQRVAVDPALPCWRCDQCEIGNPNLCRNLRFMGLYPDDGSLQECMIVPARNCFPLPDTLSMDAGALLEPLGVAIHAVDLGKLKIAKSAAVLGCGPIGLLTMRLAKLAGAGPIIAVDQYGWRLDAARAWGADEVINFRETDPVQAVRDLTGGHGVTTAFEAAWGGEAVAQAIEMADLGGRVVIVGIPSEDDQHFRPSAARRKGLTLALTRRMKHTYPRAALLTTAYDVNLDALISHRMPLTETARAYQMNADYADNVIKIMLEVSG